MKAGPDQQRVQSRAVVIGRAVLAAILALSFLAFLVPLGKASAEGSGLKACCIGKTGHESGSCSTGLIESGGQTGVPKVPPPKTRSGRFANVKGGVGSGEHCSLHASTSGHSDLAESPNTAEKTELTSASNTSSIRSVTSTCPGECGTCSVSYTRRPRPREQSTQSAIVPPRLPSLVLVYISDDQQVRSLNSKWSQLQPRAPPAILA